MALTSNQFWKIIDSTGRGVGVNRRRQVEKIERILRGFSLDDLATFRKHTYRAIKKANTFPFQVAAFVIYSHLTDDLLLEFRAWVILHGQKAFMAALKNIDTVVKLVSKKEVDQMSLAGFLEVEPRIWLDRGVDCRLYTRKVGFLQERPVPTDWPESREEFKSRYPVLYKAFWNPPRIEAFHRGARK